MRWIEIRWNAQWSETVTKLTNRKVGAHYSNLCKFMQISVMKAAGFFPPSTDFNLKPFDLKIWYLITLWMRFRIIGTGLDRIGSTGLGGCRAIPHAVQPDRLVDWIKSKKWNILFILLRCCCPLSRVYKRWSASTWTDHIDHAPNIQSECNCHAATPKRGRGEQGVEGGRGFFEIFWGNLHQKWKVEQS